MPENENTVIGRNPVRELLKSEREIDKIMVKKGKPEGSLAELIAKAKKRGIPVIETDKRGLDRMADGENHQGIIAICAGAKYATIDDILAAAEKKGEPPFVIICDKIADPHNLGAIIRSAECAGAHGVIIPKRNGAGLTAAVMKTAAGAAEYVPVARVVNIAAAIDTLKERGLWITGADMDGTPMYDVDLTGAVGLVIGSEGAGLSRLVREKCDFIASIPMFGELNSLNASAAAAVLMYEAVRKRKFDKQ